MHWRTINLAGDTFGRLTVIGPAPRPSHGKRDAVWLCRCSCGNEKAIKSSALRSGDTKSCGCFQRESTGRRRRTHGMSSHHLYQVWKDMLRRCEVTTATNYARYGGRGISVCSAWHDFETFFAWALAGFSPGLELDRRDGTRGYEPDNCRWVDEGAQAANRRQRRSQLFPDGFPQGISRSAAYRRTHKAPS